MRKISLSLTESNIAWLQAESERRGIAVSDVARRTFDEVSTRQGKPVVRCDEKGFEILTDNAARHRDVAYVAHRLIEIPNPDGEDEYDNCFVPPLKATVAEAQQGLELLREALVDAARRTNGLETILELARHRGLGPDETIEVLTKGAGEAV